MCGRYSFFDTDRLYERFEVEDHIHLEPRYNVAPTQTMPVIVNTDKRHVVPMRWGLLPVWAKEEKVGYKMINARAETLAEKRSFKNLLVHNRCLIPANGFFEWHRQDDHKQPYYIHLKHEPLFAFAGLYTEWKNPETNKVIPTYTIITTNANEPMSAIHHRMPVILDREVEDDWLNPDISEPELALKELRMIEPEEMELYPISSSVNKPTNDNPSIIRAQKL